MNIEITEASLDDLETICALRRELLSYQSTFGSKTVSEKKLKSSDNLMRTYLERDYSIMYIAYIDKQAIGFVHGTIDPKPQENIQAYLQDLYVKENYRNKGIGSVLLEKLHQFFKKHDVKWGLSTDKNNKNALKFYINKGYKISREENNMVYLEISK